MKKEKISKVEYDLLSTAINKIVCSEVLETAISKQIPTIDTLPDANKICCYKLSILFVDMRESTKLPDKFNTEQLVKIYRSYIRTLVQAVRYSGGYVRDFMGDGILAVFGDDEDGNSEDKAVHAARYITTAIDKILNPVLEENIKHRICCGIGIHTGNISLSKVGMKGKEQDDVAEDEFDIVWIGNSANLACKYSSAVDCGTIFISPSTYIALSDINAKQIWGKTAISKGNNILDGYVAKRYYLELDKDIEPCVAVSVGKALSLDDALKTQYQKQLTEIANKAQELGRREKESEDREQELNNKEADLRLKENGNRRLKDLLYEKEYIFYMTVLSKGFCKDAFVREMGYDFWDEHMRKAVASGQKMGKSESEVKQEISCDMVRIYRDLNAYHKAYDFLVEQATGFAWLNLLVVQDVVKKIGHCDKLKSALYMRLSKNDLTPENKRGFEEIKNWLDSNYPY